MIFRKEPGKLAQSIANNMLSDPEAWKTTSYNVTHDTGLEVRIGGGVGSLRLLDNRGAELPKLPRADRRVIWSAYREMLTNKMAEMVIPQPEDEA